VISARLMMALLSTSVSLPITLLVDIVIASLVSSAFQDPREVSVHKEL